MSDNYKTLRVPEDAWQDAKQQKEEHNRTWGEQIVRVEDTSTTESDVVVESVTIEAQEHESTSGVDENDVEDIVERWMEKNADRLRKGEF